MSLLFIVLIILKLTSMRKEVLKTGMNAAEVYEAPACEVMELQMEGAILQSSVEPGGSEDEDHEMGPWD